MRTHVALGLGVDHGTAPETACCVCICVIAAPGSVPVVDRARAFASLFALGRLHQLFVWWDLGVGGVHQRRDTRLCCCQPQQMQRRTASQASATKHDADTLTRVCYTSCPLARKDCKMAVWMSGKRDFLWWYILKRDSLHAVPQLGKVAGGMQESM